jgi:hypothetical protein
MSLLDDERSSSPPSLSSSSWRRLAMPRRGAANDDAGLKPKLLKQCRGGGQIM